MGLYSVSLNSKFCIVSAPSQGLPPQSLAHTWFWGQQTIAPISDVQCMFAKASGEPLI